jgi:hypothetical protein
MPYTAGQTAGNLNVLIVDGTIPSGGYGGIGAPQNGAADSAARARLFSATGHCLIGELVEQRSLITHNLVF